MSDMQSHLEQFKRYLELLMKQLNLSSVSFRVIISNGKEFQHKQQERYLLVHDPIIPMILKGTTFQDNMEANFFFFFLGSQHLDSQNFRSYNSMHNLIIPIIVSVRNCSYYVSPIIDLLDA